MPYEFKLPDLGEGVHEGEVVRWLVSEGDRVEENQPLVEVMTDKVNAEIPSPRAGTVRRLCVAEGAVIPVGTTMIVLDDGAAGGSDGQAPPPAPPDLVREPFPTTAPESSGRALAVPAVRQLARDLGVDLEQVPTSGPGGRVTLSDVRAFAARQSPVSPPAHGAGAPAVKRIPLRGLRRRIAEHLVHATQATAPFTYVDEADFTELVLLRERVKPLAEKRGVRLTYLPFIITALVASLRQHPWLNGRVDEASGELVLSDECNAGIAVEIPDGLIVPVVRNAERRSILELAAEVRRLGDAARTGKLTPEEVQGGTFSITSLGPRGGLLATPIINTPEVAILGVHRITPRPVVRDGQVVVRQVANLSLTFDHRYIDGAVGADFATTLINYLQDPAMMLFWLSELREATNEFSHR
jgi:pyruvate/2-oxoglutarate dehydrogenase complex dihydrolipoamide acyltransferase (E2) component